MTKQTGTLFGNNLTPVLLLAENDPVAPGTPFMAFLYCVIKPTYLGFSVISLKNKKRAHPAELKQRIYFRASLGDRFYYHQAKVCDLVYRDEEHCMPESNVLTVNLSLIQEWYARATTLCPKCNSRDKHFHLSINSRTSSL